jgi:hypothetical protein
MPRFSLRECLSARTIPFFGALGFECFLIIAHLRLVSVAQEPSSVMSIT